MTLTLALYQSTDNKQQTTNQ